VLTRLDLFTDSFYAVDNLHLLIVVILLSFGTGHAIFRSKFGLLTLAFLSLFIYFTYFQIQGTQWNIIAVVSFIAGITYAYRESSEGILDDWLYRVIESLSSITSKFSFKREPKPSQSDRSNQQAYEAEQARREQEAKAQREQQKNQNDQQEEQAKQKKSKQQYQRQQKHKESIEKNKPPIDTRTSLEILGLKSGFTQQELKKAYKQKTMKTHPDKWEQEPTYIQKMMEEEFKLVKKAYETLKS